MRSSTLREIFFVGIAAVAILCAPGALAQGIQKWVDKDGKVHYGDAPPPEAQANGVKVQAGPVSHDAQGRAAPAPVPRKVSESSAKEGKSSSAQRKDATRAAPPKGGKIIIDTTPQDCDGRIAYMQAQVRQYHRTKFQITPGIAEIREAERFDKWAKDEDEWLAAHCPEQNTPRLETVH